MVQWHDVMTPRYNGKYFYHQPQKYLTTCVMVSLVDNIHVSWPLTMCHVIMIPIRWPAHHISNIVLQAQHPLSRLVSIVSRPLIKLEHLKRSHRQPDIVISSIDLYNSQETFQIDPTFWFLLTTEVVSYHNYYTAKLSDKAPQYRGSAPNIVFSKNRPESASASSSLCVSNLYLCFPVFLTSTAAGK